MLRKHSHTNTGKGILVEQPERVQEQHSPLYQIWQTLALNAGYGQAQVQELHPIIFCRDKGMWREER